MIVVEMYRPDVASSTAAPIIDGHPVAAHSRPVDAGFNGRLPAMPALRVSAHTTGQASLGNRNAVSAKAWVPPPREVSL